MPNEDQTTDFARFGQRPLSQSAASGSSFSGIWKMSCLDSFEALNPEEVEICFTKFGLRMKTLWPYGSPGPLFVWQSILTSLGRCHNQWNGNVNSFALVACILNVKILSVTLTLGLWAGMENLFKTFLRHGMCYGIAWYMVWYAICYGMVCGIA